MWLGALMGLVGLAVALEILLNFGREFLLGTRRQAALDAQIQQAQADLRVSQQRIEERRKALRAAADDADHQRAALKAADQAFAESQKVTQSLVHVVGQPLSGTRFRAPITKDLPPTPDRSQKMIWSCNNFIEVWAADIDEAKALLAKQFQEKQGYKVGEPAVCAPDVPPVGEVAA